MILNMMNKSTIANSKHCPIRTIKGYITITFNFSCKYYEVYVQGSFVLRLCKAALCHS